MVWIDVEYGNERVEGRDRTLGWNEPNLYRELIRRVRDLAVLNRGSFQNPGHHVSGRIHLHRNETHLNGHIRLALGLKRRYRAAASDALEVFRNHGGLRRDCLWQNDGVRGFTHGIDDLTLIRYPSAC